MQDYDYDYEYDYEDIEPKITTGYKHSTEFTIRESQFDSGIQIFKSSIETGGRDGLSKLEKRVAMYSVDPEVKFLDNVTMLLGQLDLPLTDNDKKKILLNTSNLSLIEYKSPLAYILGYYIHLSISNSTETKRKLNSLKKEIQNTNLGNYEILKYARFWKIIL